MGCRPIGIYVRRASSSRDRSDSSVSAVMAQADGTLKTWKKDHDLGGGHEADWDMKPTRNLLQLVEAWSKVLMMWRRGRVGSSFRAMRTE